MTGKTNTETDIADEFLDAYRDFDFVLGHAHMWYFAHQDQEIDSGRKSRLDGKIVQNLPNSKNIVRAVRVRRLKRLRAAIKDLDDDLYSEINEIYAAGEKTGSQISYFILLQAIDALLKSEKGSPGRPQTQGNRIAADCISLHLNLIGTKLTSSMTQSNNTEHPRYRDGYIYSEAVIAVRDFIKELDPANPVTYSSAQSLVRGYLRKRGEKTAT